jgi:hypothetical protein
MSVPTQAARRCSFVIVLAIGTLAAIATSCRLSTDPAPLSHYGSGARRILFIGNSLTGANEMPGMLVALAESARVTPLPIVDVDSISDFALIDHWSLGTAKNLIASGHYDIVVMQQGPSSVAVNRDTLRLAAGLFAPVIRAAGGVPALFAVWPTFDRQADFDGAAESYRLAAQDVGGMLFPGGETWRAAWRRNPLLQLYSPDGLHPSPLGSFAVAVSMFGILYDRSTVGLPSSIRVGNSSVYAFDAATVRIIQDAADEANHRFGMKPTP